MIGVCGGCVYRIISEHLGSVRLVINTASDSIVLLRAPVRNAYRKLSAKLRHSKT